MARLELVARGDDGTVVLIGPNGTGAVVSPDGSFLTLRSVDSALVQSDWHAALGKPPRFVPTDRVLASIAELIDTGPQPTTMPEDEPPGG